MDFVRAELFSPEGDLLWSGDPARQGECVPCAAGQASEGALAELCGTVPSTTSEMSCTRQKVLSLAEDLGFVGREGCVRGFLVILPSGMLVEQCAEAFNRQHLEGLSAVRMQFPLVFDRGQEDLEDLTESYERQHRMFRLGSGDESLRLAYAADPGFFGWLRGRTLRREALPYAIFSPTPAFRRWKSGEIGGFDHLRQYDVPDVHVLCEEGDALARYERCVELAAEGARFWVGEGFVQFVDVVEDFYGRMPAAGARAARAARQHTLVRVLARRPRYYAFRSGIMIPAGFGLVMLYNLQYDDTNAERFGIHTDSGDGEGVVILHATVAGGWPKLLPIFLGRGLAGLGPKVLPVELAPLQVACVPLAERHRACAGSWVERLRQSGFRAGIVEPEGSLGQRLKRLRASWQPFHAVIGDREAAGEEPRFLSFGSAGERSFAELAAGLGPRIERCRPASPPLRPDLPF
jgi:threonyl-tRNA synthetase